MRALPRRLAWLSGFVVMLAVIAGAAEPVPSGLEPWRGWVLRGQEFRACPLIAGHRAAAAEDFLCAWPGMLELSADDHGADVTQRWRVEVESWIPLPGDAEYWPQQVSVDGQPAPVVDHAGSEHSRRRRQPTRSAHTFHGPSARRRCACRTRSVSSRSASTARRSCRCSATAKR